jgi:hypothetical protein
MLPANKNDTGSDLPLLLDLGEYPSLTEVQIAFAAACNEAEFLAPLLLVKQNETSQPTETKKRNEK